MSTEETPKRRLTDTINITDAGYNSSLKAADSSRLIEIEGKYGLFTPLTNPDKDEASTENMEEIIQVLKNQVTKLQTDKLSLQQHINNINQAKRRTPDDFATAISHTVDNLQSRLYDTKNPISRFAMKEFKIEANVHVNVTSMGTVEYRFIEPEENVDPARLSKIEMSLVPLPRESDEGAWTQPDFTPFTDIEEIQGIGKTYQHKLNQHNIYSISDLLTAGTRVRSNIELAAMLDVDRNKLDNWLSHAQLMTIKDIDGHKAEVLHNIGITDLNNLAGKSAEELAQTFNAKADEIGHKTLSHINADEANIWINTARAYQGKQTGK